MVSHSEPSESNTAVNRQEVMNGKMIIKVTLNSKNPAEAELMKILEDVKNRSAYLKMAAFHYCNVLGKLSLADNRTVENPTAVNMINGKQKTNAGQASEPDLPPDLDTVFANAFDR
jgi:hypothetical protein